MTSIAATIRHNESKHQVLTDETGTGVPIPDITLTRMGIMMKEFDAVGISGAHRQNEMYTVFRSFLDKVRDNNLLDRMQDGTYPTGVRIRGSLNTTGNAGVIIEAADSTWWAAAEDGEMVMQIGGEAGWSGGDASSFEMDTLGARLFEAFRETFLKKM